MNIMEGIWKRVFVKNTYSSIRGRGIHKCANDLYKDLQNDAQKTKYCLKLDIRKFYPKEYQVGIHAIEWIKEQTGEDLGDDEAAFIAMHIVSAELNAQNITDVNQITELINTVLQIVRIHFKIDLNEESISYERFLSHLKFFAARVFDHMEYEDTMQEIYKVMV